jgi:glutamate synthase (ferredoxin)
MQEAHDNGPQLADEILADPAVPAALESNGPVTKAGERVTVDRSSLARLAGAVALKHGDRGFKGQININLRGSAGQSCGCFLAGGIIVKLVGEANDYVGKGMAGGEISIVPPEASTFAPENASIVGNTCLYGATGGKLFVGGRAGERFAVRNSMAETVVEGTGDHCCEYMTGGVVVSLGSVGRNVGAGMTGGLGYFYDPEGNFTDKVNGEIVSVQRIQTQAGKNQLKSLIEEHVDRTGSASGRAILSNFDAEVEKFWQVVPPSEANTPEASPVAEEDASVAVAA